jgi:hypothetical protein
VTKASEAKKAAEAKKAVAEHADMAASRGETASRAKASSTGTAGQAMGADAAKRTTEANAAASVAEAAASAAEAMAAMTATKSAVGKGLGGESPVIPPSVSKGRVTTKEGSSSAAPLKERRTKVARDPAQHQDPLAPERGAPSTKVVVHATAPEEGDELHASRQLPLASSMFSEIHKALGEVHTVSGGF